MIVAILSMALWAGTQAQTTAQPQLLACDILTGRGSEGCGPTVNLAGGCYPADWFCGPEIVSPVDDGDGPWLPT